MRRMHKAGCFIGSPLNDRQFPVCFLVLDNKDFAALFHFHLIGGSRNTPAIDLPADAASFGGWQGAGGPA